MSGIVLYWFSPLIDGCKTFSKKCHADQCYNTNEARPLHKIIYCLSESLYSQYKYYLFKFVFPMSPQFSQNH